MAKATAKTKELEQYPVEDYILTTYTIATKKHGEFDFYQMKSGPKLPKIMMLYLTKNNPNYFAYDKESDSFFFHQYSLLYLKYACSLHFYMTYLNEVEKNSKGKLNSDLNVVKSYFRKFIESDQR